MNDNLQPGQHLDADTLGAFAEGALPAHERDAAAEHLAACFQCREVLGLALPPFEELQPLPVVTGRRGFAGWRWVWAGAAACAGVGLASIALLRHPTPAAAPATMARVEAPAAPAATPPPVPVPAPARPALAKPSPQPVPKPAPPSPKAVVAAGRRVAPEGASALPGGNVALGSLAAANPAGVARSQTAQAEPRAGLAQQAQVTLANGYLLGGREQAHAPSAAPALKVPAAASPAAAPPPAPPVRAKAAAASTMEVTTDHDVVETSNASVSQLLPELPSRLPTASRAANGMRVVAADSAGALFFSKDGGRHWKAIKGAWHGRVVRVEQAASTTPAAAADVAAAVFALVTSDGERWVSSDGRKWVQQ